MPVPEDLEAVHQPLYRFSDLHLPESELDPRGGALRTPSTTEADLTRRATDLWDRKTNKVELFGHAAVRQPGETLEADYIVLDLNSRDLDARGNCVYLDRRYGDLRRRDALQPRHAHRHDRRRARVERQLHAWPASGSTSLGPAVFRRIGASTAPVRIARRAGRFRPKTSTCEVEGYAFMSNVTTKVKDTPALLAPVSDRADEDPPSDRYSLSALRLSSTDGFVFVQPYFWAINRSSDMTIGLGEYFAMRARRSGKGAMRSRSEAWAGRTFSTPMTRRPPRFRIPIAGDSIFCRLRSCPGISKKNSN